jgi:hypothetical protein
MTTFSLGFLDDIFYFSSLFFLFVATGRSQVAFFVSGPFPLRAQEKQRKGDPEGLLAFVRAAFRPL